MQDLGTLGGSESWAYDVSADGAVVVGVALNAAGQRRAFRWTASGGMEDLNLTYASLLTTARCFRMRSPSPPMGGILWGLASNAATGRGEAFLLDTQLHLLRHNGDVDTVTGASTTLDLLGVLFAFGELGQRPRALRRCELGRGRGRRGLADCAVQLRQWVLSPHPQPLSHDVGEGCRGEWLFGQPQACRRPLHLRARGSKGVRANLYTPTSSSCLRYRSRWSWGRVRQIRNCLRRMFRNRRLTRFQLAMSPLRRVRVSRMSYTPA
jgi:probable HAF family extracellular repeat protein